MTRTPTRILAALAAVLLLSGAKCARVDSDRPPADRQVDPKRERVVLITAHGDGPYTVLVLATEAGKGSDHTGPEHVAAGEYRQTLSYTGGLKIVIRVSVKGSPGDWFECAITDGTHRDHERRLGDVVCILTTSR